MSYWKVHWMRKAPPHCLLYIWKMVWSYYNSPRYLLSMSHHRNGTREKIDMLRIIEVCDLKCSSYLISYQTLLSFKFATSNKILQMLIVFTSQSLLLLCVSLSSCRSCTRSM